jgi:hypothetical protein
MASLNPGTMAISGGATTLPAGPAAAPRPLVGDGSWPLLRRQRLITTRAATMISALHSATSISSSPAMISPPGERSHVVPYPASPYRYHSGRDPGRSARWQPSAYGQLNAWPALRPSAGSLRERHVPL